MRKMALDIIYELARHNERIVFIGSDLGSGVLDKMKEEMPKRFLMEGVSEQHIIGMAAGLAMDGFIPYVNTIATFLTRRCFEQIALDLCLQDLPVRLVANGGGVVYAPLGPTHLAVEDIAILRSLPNMAIVAPCDAVEMRGLMTESIQWPHPIYFRVAKGGDPVISRLDTKYQIGKAVVMRDIRDALFISTGVMTQTALKAAEILNQEGLSCGVLHMHTIKPLDIEALIKWIPLVERVITVEEHTRIGGLGSAVLEFCSDTMPEQCAKVWRVGLPDRFAAQYGSQNSLLEHFEITPASLAHHMRSWFR